MTRTQKILFVSLVCCLRVAAQIPGRNVNMVSGTTWPAGDPFLQRQNEPSLAVSSRNPAHLLAGSNDYRTVDLPGLPEGETGDAWLGVFKSYDGGQSWRSTVHPGCAQKTSACDGAPLLKNYAAGADPVVRAGTNGLFYFAGIAFTRDAPKKSVVFVSRFIDNNNEEGGDPIKYVDTNPVAAGNDTVFVDKPWLAVDIPRAGAGTCGITVPLKNGNPLLQKFPAGNAYLAYTTFGDETKPPSQILFSRTTDCGATWSKPYVVAGGALHQGASLAVDPNTGAVYMSWRRFKSTGFTDAIMFAQSNDGGLTFSTPREVATISPFEQGTTGFSFRTNAYPTMAVDGAGRIYLAWSERNRGAAASGGDARIVLTTSRDGRQWTERKPVNDYPARGHQFMPAMTFGGGKVMVIFYDLRGDNTVGNFASTGDRRYVEKRVPAGDLATVPPHPEKVFTNFLLDAAPAGLNLGGLLRRHTLDVFSAQADAGDAPLFTAARISQYIFGSRPGSMLIEQLQVNPPNLPLFKQGSAPFIGDYLDVAASPSFLPGDTPGTWKFNTDPSRASAFHAVWTDNRDVRPPANGDWADYTPPTSGSSSGLSIFDPSKPQPACRTGQAGMRNQNIYTARITQGLLVTSPSNAKTLGTLERAFPITVANSTTGARNYRLTIVNQPRGGKSTFLQVPVNGLPDPLTVLDVSVAAGSSISRMIFVRSTDARASVRVNVDEIGAVGGRRLNGGLQGSLLLNPDPLNPDNADPTLKELFNPDIANPDIANPDIANPDIANPDIANPDIANPDIANGTISDTTWRLTNKGNTTATYTVRFLLTGFTIPAGVKTQLVIHRVYTTPLANGCALVEEPHLVVVSNIPSPLLLDAQNSRRLRAVIAGRTLPRHDRLTLQSADEASEIIDDSLGNATVNVAPGETIYVTLRFFNPDRTQPLPFDPGDAITTVSVSHAINTGETQPSVAASHLFVATTVLPAGVSGRAYSHSLIAAGGNKPYTWTLSAGSLPPGLALSPDGTIAGTITGAANLYNFTVQVADGASPPHVLTQALSIQVSRVALAIMNLAAAGPAGASVKPGDTITVTATVSNTGSVADSVIADLNLVTVGSASANCSGPKPPIAALPNGGQQTITFTCSSVSGNGSLAFEVGITAVDGTTGVTVSVNPATSNPVTVVGKPPEIAASATSGGVVYSAGTWTNRDVTVTFTCTPAGGVPVVRTVTVTTEGAGQSASDTCADSAGVQASASFTGINIDKTAPGISVAATAGGQPYHGAVTSKDVTVTFTCTDPGGSGVTQEFVQQVFTSTGTGLSAEGTCIDRAGNTSSATFGPINIVRTLPELRAILTAGGRPYTTGTWTNQVVDVAFNCTPAAGIARFVVTPPVTVSDDGGSQFVDGSCTDEAGNRREIRAGPIDIDRVPPAISILNRPPANANGWNNTAVTITWACSDPLSGPREPNVTRTVSSDGAGQAASATCTDQAGNTASATETVNLDKTPPVIAGVASPGVPGNGWYREPVSVAFTCTDTLSGVTPGYPQGNTSVTDDTPGMSVIGTCRDVAGNLATTAVGPIRIDRTPPVLQLQSVVPLNPATGWSNAPVTVTWACTDTGSGPVTPIVTRTAAATGTVNATCSDVAGNSASASHDVHIDTTPPFVTVISPVNGIAYRVGDTVIANFICTPVPEIASCVGTVASGAPLPLTVPGTYTFTVTATDLAGNRTQVTRSYSVIAADAAR